MLLGQSVFAQYACIEKTVIPLQIETIKDLIEIKTKSWPSVSTDFCYGRRSCSYFTEYNEIPKPKPNGFFCEEDSIYESISPEVLDKKICNLTPEEFLAINDYSGEYYQCMNAYLRQNKVKSPEIEGYIQKLNSALDKLPNYEGIVIRGADLSPELAKIHSVGAVVTYNAFTSTSTEDLAWGNDRFIILSKTGKPIMSFSSHNNENEILFKSGTQFKILSMFKENNLTFYVMKEVTSSSSPVDDIKADLALIEKFKSNTTSQGRPDRWLCPEELKNVPKIISQKTLPVFNPKSSEQDEDEEEE